MSQPVILGNAPFNKSTVRCMRIYYGYGLKIFTLSDKKEKLDYFRDSTFEKMDQLRK
jgi:hypothetical protein